MFFGLFLSSCSYRNCNKVVIKSVLTAIVGYSRCGLDPSCDCTSRGKRQLWSNFSLIVKTVWWCNLTRLWWMHSKCSISCFPHVNLWISEIWVTCIMCIFKWLYHCAPRRLSYLKGFSAHHMDPFVRLQEAAFWGSANNPSCNVLKQWHY